MSNMVCNNPLVSMCTPVYNGEEHLEECIKGVLNQTYDNYEYIIVDNASTDGTAAIIETYRKKDPRIRMYRNEETLCMEDNWNLCAKYCLPNSKWLKYALADDYLFPDCVEKMVKVGESDEQIGMVSAYRIAGDIVTNMGLPIDQNVVEGAIILKLEIIGKLYVAGSSPNSIMYRREVFSEMKGFNNKYEHSDTELAFRLLDKYKFGFVHYVLTKSRREKRGGFYYSIMHGHNLIELLDFGYKNLNRYKSVSLDTYELSYLKMHYADRIMSFIISKVAYFQWQDIRAILINTPKEIKKELGRLFLRDFSKYIKLFIKSIMRIRS